MENVQHESGQKRDQEQNREAKRLLSFIFIMMIVMMNLTESMRIMMR